MSGWWFGASIRVRLTAWYTAVLALMLVVYATTVFLAVRHEFREQLEEEQQGNAATPEERVEEELGEILLVLVLGLPPIVVLAGVGGYVLARRALAPIDHLGAEARRIYRGASTRTGPIGSKSEGRNRETCSGHQRDTRSPRVVIRAAPALHGRRVTRAENAVVRPSGASER
jgi:hypothetical protein